MFLAIKKVAFKLHGIEIRQLKLFVLKKRLSGKNHNVMESFEG